MEYHQDRQAACHFRCEGSSKRKRLGSSGRLQFTQTKHPSHEAKKLSNFSLFLGCALPCYRNCFPCYFLSVSGQEIPKKPAPAKAQGIDFPSGNRDFPAFFPVLAAETGSPRTAPSASQPLAAPFRAGCTNAASRPASATIVLSSRIRRYLSQKTSWGGSE